MIGEVEVEEREKDASGQVYLSAAELMAEEVRRRGGGCCAGRRWAGRGGRECGGGEVGAAPSGAGFLAGPGGALGLRRAGLFGWVGNWLGRE